MQRNDMALEVMCLSDEEFESHLKTNDHLQRVFQTTVSEWESSSMEDGETDSVSSQGIDRDMSETDHIAMLYIEHALLNRARFACGQKYLLSMRFKHISSNELKHLVKEAANKELTYVSELLKNFKSPDIEHARDRVLHWLGFTLEDDVMDEKWLPFEHMVIASE
jgi:hypothetical protein